ncbi:MAG: hypothetical protein ACSHXY_13390 [Alphaproteobacteria bacterium]
MLPLRLKSQRWPSTGNVTRAELDKRHVEQATFGDLMKHGSANIDGNLLAVSAFWSERRTEILNYNCPALMDTAQLN